MTGKHIRWKPAVDRVVRTMFFAGEPVRAIADAIGVSPPSVESRIIQLRLRRSISRADAIGPKRPGRPNLSGIVYPKREAEEPLRADHRHSFRLSEEQRQRLAAPHRDLAGYFFGDPPVGFSALDKRA